MQDDAVDDASAQDAIDNHTKKASSPPANPSNRRVKTYRLEQDSWTDLGTGWCLLYHSSNPPPTQTKPLNTTQDDLGPWIVVVPEHSTQHPNASVTKSDDTDELLQDDQSESQDPEPRAKRRKLEQKADWPPEIWRSSMRTIILYASQDQDRGGFQRQQDTLIVWTEADGTDMALSFANVAGCAEVWDFIDVLKDELVPLAKPVPADAMDEDDADVYASYSDSKTGKTPPSSPPVRASNNNSSMFGSRSNAGLGVSPSQIGTSSMGGGLLPRPNISNLEDVETALKWAARTPSGRERLASWIVKTDYLSALADIMTEAEDLESLEALHTLCLMTQSILLLNDNTIFEYILSDDLFLKIVGMLEYDPDFGSMKANYRAHLSDPTRYREVVPIEDEQTMLKIHQTYRLQYLKDVILARIIDDPTFSMLNSFIFFHQVDIVQHLQHNHSFLEQLFGIFDSSVNLQKTIKPDKPAVIGPQLPSETDELAEPAPPRTEEETRQQRHGAILLLQQFCSFAKNLQLSNRNTFYRQMGERGLLRVLEKALAVSTSDRPPEHHTEEEEEQSIRIATIDILMMVIDHNPGGVRAYCLKQEADEKQSLVTFLIKLLIREKDLGIQAQMAEALKVLVQTGPDGAGVIEAMRARPEDPEAERFLQYFYDSCINPLFQPIADLPDPTTLLEGRITLSTAEQALCSHLCDLLCYFVTAHTFRSKYFLLSSTICVQVARLFKTTQKHMTLAGLRFFKATIARKDDFYNRYLIKNDLFLPVIETAQEETGKDNLLSSACLDFFEHIRSNNTKAIINHLIDKHGDLVRTMTSDNQTLGLLLMKWEQNNEPSPELKAAQEAITSRPSVDRLTRTLEAEEESYFEDSSDEEESSQTPPTAKRKVQLNGSKKRLKPEPKAETDSATKGMVRSPAQVFQEMAIKGAQGKARAQRKANGNNALPASAKLVDYGNEDHDDVVKQEVFQTVTEDPVTPTKKPAQDGVDAFDSALGSPFVTIKKNEEDITPPPSLKTLSEKRQREEDEEEAQFANKRQKLVAKPNATGKKIGLANGFAGKLKVNLSAMLNVNGKEKT